MYEIFKITKDLLCTAISGVRVRNPCTHCRNTAATEAVKYVSGSPESSLSASEAVVGGVTTK